MFSFALSPAWAAVGADTVQSHVEQASGVLELSSWLLYCTQFTERPGALSDQRHPFQSTGFERSSVSGMTVCSVCYFRSIVEYTEMCEMCLVLGAEALQMHEVGGAAESHGVNGHPMHGVDVPCSQNFEQCSFFRFYLLIFF